MTNINIELMNKKIKVYYFMISMRGKLFFLFKFGGTNYS